MMFKRAIFTTVTITIGAILILCGILTLLFFQSVVDIVIASQLPLRKGTDTFELWRKPPATPILRVYFFNVSNSQEFLQSNGSVKLVLQEFGPYTWSEKWEKVDVKWHPNGTVSYRQNKIYYFERTLSVGSENDSYVLPNIPLLSALASLKNSAGVAKKAVSTILDILKLQPFHERSVKEMMWGYDDPLLRLGKSILPEGKRVPFDQFGLFYGKNNTPGQIYTVFTGKESLAQFAKIDVWNGKTQLDFWKNPYDTSPNNCTKNELGSEEEEIDEEDSTKCARPIRSDDYCNMINGTDATGFPSNLNENSTLYIFQPDLCRSLRLDFQGKTIQQEIPALRFVPAESTFGDVETFPENICYCVDGPPCSRQGTFNVSVCQFSSPVFLSWPHFLHGDPSLLAAVDGLHPDPNRHQFYMDIQPKLGIPLQAKGRIQINIQMTRIREIPQAARLDNVLIPVIWFEDGIEKLPETIMSLLRQAVFVPDIAQLALTIGFFGFGIILCLSGFVLIVKSYHVKRSQATSQIHPEIIEDEMVDKGKGGVKNGMTIPYTNGGLELDEKKIGITSNSVHGNVNGIENGGLETAT